jgi:hydroxymethylpyrimidine pyrophosphatase-like HAD family hydrolase
MKFNVLAVDYDGTIAESGKANHAVLEAIAEARERGITVVLVTGRIVNDLRRVFDRLDLFDAVVAENGAVLAFPNGRTMVLGRSPSPALLAELRRLNVDFAFGDCILEADVSSSPTILELVRKLELPLALIFNRDRVIVIPHGINKATGLREALNTLRLSLHNCIAMGDAENDYQLLDACEIGIAMSWGSRILREVADEMLPGRGPGAVADYIRRVIKSTKLPPNRSDRRRVQLGFTSNGRSLSTAVHGRNILIAGDPRSGKSWAAGLLCEQLILQGYCLCVIDPEGDYATLESLPYVVMFGGNQTLPHLSDIARELRYPDISLVINLSQAPHDEKVAYVAELLPLLVGLRKNSGQPHWIVVDEAHYFLYAPNIAQQVDLELAAYIFVTYRPSDLHADLLQSIESIIVTRLTDPREVSALTAIYGPEGAESEWESLIGGLQIDEAALLPKVEDSQRRLRQFKVAKRLTTHVRHRSKYVDVPKQESQGFVFTRDGMPVSNPARTFKEFVTTLEHLPLVSVEDHAQRGDFSRWVADVFGDHALAVEIGDVENKYREGEAANVRELLLKLIRERYEVMN